MSTITTKDGIEIYYKDWGEGPVVLFSHGWPLNADAWDGQMLFLAQNGFRAIAHDRRGHGRSSQPSSGNDMDTYADDLAALIEALDATSLWWVTRPAAVRSRGTSGATERPEDDQIVPVRVSSMKTARLITGAKDVYYPGAPHGITATHQDQVNAELLAFLRSSPAQQLPDRMMATSIAG